MKRISQKSEDYAEISDLKNENESRNLEINRHQLQIGDLLGVGQFGDVYKGIYRTINGDLRPVAIKTCKEEMEMEMAGKLLREAYIMSQFDHPHITQLIGINSSTPVLIVMELAALGEIRGFLEENRVQLSQYSLISYCFQLSTALAYLETKHFVHRDIAARNVLVAKVDCVKLADFGLSRMLRNEDSYTASAVGKLPIKWMAPESINYRRFSTATDVWMFGVCMWEILMYGIKPFVGVANNEVIGLIENGIRLQAPPGCPPDLEDILVSCWQFEPNMRPNFDFIQNKLSRILSAYTCSGENIQCFIAPTKPYRSNQKANNNNINSSNTNILYNNYKEQLARINLDRNGDLVYMATLEVVKIIMKLTQLFNDSKSQCAYTQLAMEVGIELRKLMARVQEVLPTLLEESHQQISMAEKLLISDMSDFIRKVKLVDENRSNVMFDEYKRMLLQSGHVIAVDSKNLLETVDTARKLKLILIETRHSLDVKSK